MKRLILPSVFIAFALVSCMGPQVPIDRVVTNPLDLDYSFRLNPDPDDPDMACAFDNGTREAADPVMGLYKGTYYLFPSKSKGYWSSDDMISWQYIPCTVLPIDLYAPTVMTYKGEFYWMTSDTNELYKTTNPSDGSAWVLVTDHLNPYPSEPERTCHDPYLFKDDDERVYLYYGCSDWEDIMGLELDPQNDFAAKGEPVTLIRHMWETYGWERAGSNNEIDGSGWNEGVALIKHDGTYYLQYAAPGTNCDTYGVGLYVGDSPLGPFEHCDYSPICIKQGGWMTGAGHGETFRDKYGNWWQVASTVISNRYIFERRVGLFPMVMTPKGHLYALTQWTDLPYVMPDGPVDFAEQAPWTGWMDLSLHKTVTASSSLEGLGPERASDNSIKTLWSAQSGEAGEWLMMDLGRKSKVCALQTNFADQDFGFYDPEQPKTPYKYIVECSTDGHNWTMLFDHRDNSTTKPHELLVLPKPVKTRYLRITNMEQLSGRFSIYDLRVFGIGSGRKPARVSEITVQREQDRRRYHLSWPEADRAQGYILHWGTDPDEMYDTYYTESPDVELGLFSVDQEYYFSVDSFNESGVTLSK